MSAETFGAYDTDNLFREIGGLEDGELAGADRWWYGITGDLALDPVEIQFEADVYQALWHGDRGNRTYKAAGWFGWLDAAFTMGDVAKVGLAGFIASGNSNDSYINKDGSRNYTSNNFSQIATLDRTDGCVLDWDNLFVRDGVAYNLSEADDVVPFSENDNTLRNMWSVKLYVTADPVDWLTVGVNGNAYWKANSYRGREDGERKYYGTEFDLDLAVKIYDQLTWTIEGGYMFVSDDALDNDPQGEYVNPDGTYTSAAYNAVGVSDDEDDSRHNNNIWAVTSGLVYNF